MAGGGTSAGVSAGSASSSAEMSSVSSAAGRISVPASPTVDPASVAWTNASLSSCVDASSSTGVIVKANDCPPRLLPCPSSTVKLNESRVVFEPSVEMYHFENVTSGNTAQINYTYVTIKNGMRFKRKWRFMFENEGGPLDSELEWAEIEKVALSDIGDLDTVD